ncbi:MAG: hypothetical protein Q8Q58_00935 [Candidatus Rokubacteria bacterium]|nr:hypothetical protein [Candidatus Rokubacteria bacterium]
MTPALTVSSLLLAWLVVSAPAARASSGGPLSIVTDLTPGCASRHSSVNRE